MPHNKQPGLMPTVLLGSAVGAAVVYGIDEGDPMAVQKKVGAGLLVAVGHDTHATHMCYACARSNTQQAASVAYSNCPSKAFFL